MGSYCFQKKHFIKGRIQEACPQIRDIPPWCAVHTPSPLCTSSFTRICVDFFHPYCPANSHPLATSWAQSLLKGNLSSGETFLSTPGMSGPVRKDTSGRRQEWPPSNLWGLAQVCPSPQSTNSTLAKCHFILIPLGACHNVRNTKLARSSGLKETLP